MSKMIRLYQFSDSFHKGGIQKVARLLNPGMFFIEQQTFVRWFLLMKRLVAILSIQKMKVVRNAPDRLGVQTKMLSFGTCSKGVLI